MSESVSPVRPSGGANPDLHAGESARISQGSARRVYAPWTRREVLAILFLLALAVAFAVASDTWGQVPAALAAADRTHLVEVIP